MPGSLALRQAIEAAACLCGQRDEKLKVSEKSEEARLAIRLQERLYAYYNAIGRPLEGRKTEKSVEDETGDCVLDVLQMIHKAIIGQTVAESSTSASLPLLGARDLQTLQTTLAIAVNWKLSPLVAAFDHSIYVLESATISSETSAKLQEVPDDATLNQRRQMEMGRLQSIIFDMGQTLEQLKPIVALDSVRSNVSNAVLNTCAPQIIAIAIRVVWGPTLRKEDQKRELVKQQSSNFLNKLLRSLSTSSCLKVLSAAGHVTSSQTKKVKTHSIIPTFVKSATEHLYSAQLLRSDGVMSLLRNAFGSDEDQGSSLMKKLVSTGHLLSTPPLKMPITTFASIIIPRLLEVISELPSRSDVQQQQIPSQLSTSTQKMAACFALARLHEVAPETIAKEFQSHLWHSLLPTVDTPTSEAIAPSSGPDRIHAAVELLFEIVEHSEPSTSFLSFLITPTVISLFTLHSFLRNKRGPAITETKGKGKSPENALHSMTWSILTTWIRLTDVQEALEVLSPSKPGGLFGTSSTSVGAVKDAVDGSHYPFWERKGGRIDLVFKHARSGQDLASALSTVNLQDLQPPLLHTNSEEADFIPDSILSALDLSPSPSLLSLLLKESARQDVASEMLSVLLESYSLAKQSEKSLSISTPTSTDSVLFVQHIFEIINAFGSEILIGQAKKILSFINFALGTSSLSTTTGEEKSVTGKDATTIPVGKKKGEDVFASLTSIGQQSSEDHDKDTVDDDDEPDEELIETALNLLLSLLEGNPDVSMETHTILKLITSKVEAQASVSKNNEIRALAKEARLVLTARQSAKVSTSSSKLNSTGKPLQQAYMKGNEVYQEALRFLQDPILPVRAHGLVLLKELAACGSSDVTKDKLMDPALTTAILDIYIQAIQDDESFLYLNAVKGIAEMANSGGKRMIKRLVGLYLGSLNDQGTSPSRAQIDLQLRMGEALLQVIQKLEEALSPHVDEIVEPLLTALRQAKRPTTLRSSYLSILGTCVEACPMVFSTSELGDKIVDAMLDLLSVETTTTSSSSKSTATIQEEMEDPTGVDSKLPQLRRAAVLLLALFIRGSRHQWEEAQEKKRERDLQQDSLTSLRLPNGSIIGGSSSMNQTHTSKSHGSLLFSKEKTNRTKTVLGYVAHTDNDGLVRHQSKELLEELQSLTLAMYTE